MSVRAENCYLALMAKRIEEAIIGSGNPFVEVYLDSMDCSVAGELEHLRRLQEEARRTPNGDLSVISCVLNKYLFGWNQADRFLAVIGLKPSDGWAKGWYASQRLAL